MIDEVINGYHFRSICETDKELYMSLKYEASNYAAAYKAMEGLADLSWNEDLAGQDTINMMVFKEPEEAFVAACSFQNIHNDDIQLGYDVVAALRGKGVGTEVVKNLIVLAHRTFPD